ncbi:MAG TPA: hypothetical protein VEQ59_10625 [Polyangiaceae bacterium]|nr:hypothetical protein [Polyangiaceae bacterium]
MSNRFGMTVARRVTVTALLLLLIGAHLVDLVVDSEQWPFSNYPMYSWKETQHFIESQRLLGVRADNGQEISLQPREFTEPFDQSRLAEAFKQIDRAPDAAERWSKAMPNLFDIYERRRRAGQHSGPALRGMRAYFTRHELDPEARNLEHPEHRKLLAEIMRP